MVVLMGWKRWVVRVGVEGEEDAVVYVYDYEMR